MSTRLAEAAVVGMRHAEPAEEVGAAVALKPGMSRGAVRLRQGAGCRVLVPAAGAVIEALPKGPTGKILNREIVVPDEEAAP